MNAWSCFLLYVAHRQQAPVGLVALGERDRAGSWPRPLVLTASTRQALAGPWYDRINYWAKRVQVVSAKWPHHHFTHRTNLMWLERYADAAEAFRQAIQLRQAHLHSRFGLAAALFKLGDLRGVQRTAKEIKDIGGPVHTDPAKWLDLVPKIPNPVLRKADYPSAVDAMKHAHVAVASSTGVVVGARNERPRLP